MFCQSLHKYVSRFKVKTTYAYLLEHHPVDVRIEPRHQQCRYDDCTEVQEHQIVVLHDPGEQALHVAVLALVPAHEWQEAYQSP